MGQILSLNKQPIIKGMQPAEEEQQQQLRSGEHSDSLDSLFDPPRQEVLPPPPADDGVDNMQRPPPYAESAPGFGQSSGEIKRPASLDPSCELCKQELFSSGDVPKEPKCAHELCSLCLHRYVHEILFQRDQSTVICPNITCKVAIDPELCQDLVPPRLFIKWMNAHRKGREELKSDQMIKVSTERSSKRSREASRISSDHHHTAQTKKLRSETQIREQDQIFDDPKGKKLASDLPRSMSATFYCSICMESKPLAESFDIASCSHMFCRGCMSSYVAAKAEEKATQVQCPEPDCKLGVLEPAACRPILLESVFRRWGSALCESALGTEQKFYCPYKDCSALLLFDGLGDGSAEAALGRAVDCPHCQRSCCCRCKVPWHEGMDCEEFQKLGEEERGGEDMMLIKMAMERKWKRCPKCKIFVDKISGCNFINCRCGHCFCYRCSSPMSKENHYCKKCNTL